MKLQTQPYQPTTSGESPGIGWTPLPSTRGCPHHPPISAHMRYLETAGWRCQVARFSASVNDLHDGLHGFERCLGLGEYVASDFIEAEFSDGEYVFGDLL